jgi:hypothetical protein
LPLCVDTDSVWTGCSWCCLLFLLLWLVCFPNCRRYATGAHLLAISVHFGQGQLGPSLGRLSRIIGALESHIHKHAAETLRGFHPGLFTREKLAFYAASVAAKGCLIPNTFGFIDGCRWMVARPGGHPQYQVRDAAGHSLLTCAHGPAPARSLRLHVQPPLRCGPLLCGRSAPAAISLLRLCVWALCHMARSHRP